MATTSGLVIKRILFASLVACLEDNPRMQTNEICFTINKSAKKGSRRSFYSASLLHSVPLGPGSLAAPSWQHLCNLGQWGQNWCNRKIRGKSINTKNALDTFDYLIHSTKFWWNSVMDGNKNIFSIFFSQNLLL